MIQLRSQLLSCLVWTTSRGRWYSSLSPPQRSANAPYSTLPEWSAKPGPGETVHLAMSGGVDSSVVALLLSRHAATLHQHSLNLKPVYMRNWSTLEESDNFEPGSGGAAGCEWQQEYEQVQAVCEKLRLPEPTLLDLSKEYWSSVFAPSLDDWQSGKTPNPDVLCNREIKFGALLDRLIPPITRSERPKSWLATGHYAKIVYADGSDQPQLHRALFRPKDQSYFLSSVPSSALRHALFPLAGLTKPQVRRLAADAGLPTATTKESMGLCFVGRRGGTSATDKTAERPQPPDIVASGKGRASTRRNSFGAWLSAYLAPSCPHTTPGPIVSAIDGSVLGQHEGLHTLTIGQSARLGGQKEKWFVVGKRIAQPQGGDGPGSFEALALVAPGSNHPLLTCTRVDLPADQFEWVATTGAPAQLAQSGAGMQLLAQVRHRSPDVPCKVEMLPSREMVVNGKSVNQPALLRVSFPYEESRPIAICPGQVLALYDGQRCLGSGVIPDLPGSVVTLGQEQADRDPSTKTFE